MKKSCSHLLNLLLIVLATSCSVTEKISQWQDKTITPDGIPAEYPIPLSHFDQDTKIQYTFSNDLDNLYFCIRATEEEAQIKILRAGVQILIDTTGKGKDFVSIQFPLPHDKNQAPPPNNKPDMKPEPNDSKNPRYTKGGNGDVKPLFGLDEMQLDGFKDPINGRVPVNSHGIKFSIKIDSDKNMTFEGVIPFNTFYKEKLSATEIAKQFTILVKLNAMITPQMDKDIQAPPMNGDGNRPPGGSDGGRPSGNMRQGGGGMPPGNGMQQPSGGMPDDRSGSVENSKSYPFNTVNTIKIKYRLALTK